MKYFATVNDQTYEIDIDHHGRITVDGIEITADLKLVEGRQLIHFAGQCLVRSRPRRGGRRAEPV